MDNDKPTIYKHPEFGNIRTAGTPEQPLFCAKDVCTALGYANARDAIKLHVDAEEVVKCYPLSTKGGKQSATYINESGLYALIFGSTLPAAKTFKRWVTSEVLPSIRTSGGYQTTAVSEANPQALTTDIDRQVQSIQDAITVLGKRLDFIQASSQEMVKNAIICRLDLAVDNVYTVTQIANALHIRPTDVNKFLEVAGVQERKDGEWNLTPEYAGKGYAKRVCDTKSGHSYLMWTPKGYDLLCMLAIKGITAY